MQAGNKLFLRKIIFLNFDELQRDSNPQPPTSIRKPTGN